MKRGTLSAGSNRGFTLLEMLVVLTIAGAMTALVAPALSRGIGAVSAVASERDLMTALQRARSSAIFNNRQTLVVLSPASHSMEIVTPQNRETKSLALAVTSDSDRVYRYRFFPDGSGAGDALVFEVSGQRKHLTIEPLTGRLSVAVVQ